jgi:hypothetical protein
MAESEYPRICIDRVIPDELNPARAAAARAVHETLATAFAGSNEPELRADDGVIPPTHMAVVNLKKWENGRTLRCRFLDGDDTQKSRVKQKAVIWQDYANIKLQFVDSGAAELRISFSADPGSWSAIGTDCLVTAYFPLYQPTMNFGWLKADTDDNEYERVVVHEFGHALGCIHEHQSPSEHLNWDQAAVTRYFSGPPNFWDPDTIKHNILQKYSPAGLKYTPFDPDSIMLYQFPNELFRDHKGTKLNTHLSALDKKFIAQMYPKGR